VEVKISAFVDQIVFMHRPAEPMSEREPSVEI